MGIRRVSLIVFSMVTIFSIGLAPNLVYAGGEFFPPEFDNNFVHSTWEFVPGVGPVPGSNPISDFDRDLASQFLFFPLVGPTSRMECSDGPIGAPLECRFLIPNFIDRLDTKTIFIDITFDPGGPPPIPVPSPGSPTVTCFDTPDIIPAGQNSGIFIDQGFDGTDIFVYDFKCEPNPDWEEITILLDRNVLRVEIWTASFDDTNGDIPVGGTFVPIDQTALLLAGVQSISMWMIPVVVAGIGIGIFVIKRRN